MRTPRQWRSTTLLLAVLWGPACGDDTTVTPTTSDAETTSTGTDTLTPAGTSTSGADTTETASAGTTGTSSTGDSTGSSTSGETESTTGEPAVSGRTMSQLVSAGTRTSSRSYTLVHTLGQPSPLQSTHTSTGYTLRGGLVGANGSPP